MEIRDFILLMWRGVRFLALGLLLGVAVAVAAIVIQPPTYEGTTKVLVSRPRQQTTSSVDLLPLSEDQLVTTNALLVKTKPVLDEAAYELGVKIDPDNVTVTVLPNTLIIQIKVQDSDPKQAAAIANTLVKILIQENDSILAGRYATTESALTAQIADAQKQIDTLQTQFTQMNDASIQEQLKLVNQQTDQLTSNIASLQNDINNFPVTLTVSDRAALADKQAQLEQDRSLLGIYQQIQVNLTFTGQPGQNGNTRDIPALTNIQSNINLFQQRYLGLQNSLQSNRSDRTDNAPSVLQIDPAVAPKVPVRPMPLLYILLGGMVGFALAAGTILVIDYLTNPLKSAHDAEKLLGVPVLGFVSDGARSKNGLVALHNPLSPDAEEFRSLGAGIEVARGEGKLDTLMIANASETEAKTAVAANLAITYAQQGKPVMLLDGDLRHPHLHTRFGMPNQNGLADIVNAGADETTIGDCVENVQKLTLVPSGVPTGDSTRWMDAAKWAPALSRLAGQADLVIIDSPSPETADAQTLASSADAVVLVIRAGQTHSDAALATLRRLRLAGAKVLGTVLYHAPHQQSIDAQIMAWAKSKLPAKTKKEDHSAAASKVEDAPILPS